jgi:glutamine amidotransferase
MNIKLEHRSNKIVIVDYGMGNISSIANMIKKTGGESMLSSDTQTILNAKKIILPGVGSFDAGIRALRDSNLDKTIIEAVGNGSIILGICLGFQLLFENSEEGTLPGLGLIKGEVKKFLNTSSLRVPHMGWNSIEPKSDSILFNRKLEENNPLRFYFVHSYYTECHNESDISASCIYGNKFTCAIENKNILGVQFHPEKSHKYGIDLFKRFLNA